MARKDEYETGTPETIVGATVKIEGDLASEGDIRVEGFLTGKIKTSKNLFVGSMAKIEADVEAGNATVSGHIKGDVKVREVLVIEQTGKVEGNVACQRFSVMEGAHFSGTCTMPEKGAEAAEPIPEEE